MAEKILFVSPRLSDTAVLSGSSQVTSLPYVNIQNQEPSKVWRTTSKLNQYVDFAFPTPVVVNAAAFTWSEETLSASAVCRLVSYALVGDIGVTPAVDSGSVSVWPSSGKHSSPEWGPEVGLVRIANTNATRYYRLYLSDANAPQDYLDIGRVALATAIQFKVNPRYEGGIGFVPLDIQEPNGYGQIFTDPRPYQQRQFELVWASLAQNEVQQDAMELSRLRGQAGDLYVFLNPAETTMFHLKSMQALFESQHKFSPTTTYVPDKDGAARLGWAFSLTLTQKL